MGTPNSGVPLGEIYSMANGKGWKRLPHRPCRATLRRGLGRGVKAYSPLQMFNIEQMLIAPN